MKFRKKPSFSTYNLLTLSENWMTVTASQVKIFYIENKSAQTYSIKVHSVERWTQEFIKRTEFIVVHCERISISITLQRN